MPEIEPLFELVENLLSIISRAVKLAPVTERSDVQARADALHARIAEIKAHDAERAARLTGAPAAPVERGAP